MTLISVNEENFEQEVLRSALPVVVDVYGPQCPECIPLLRAVGQLAGDYEGKAKFAELNSAPNRRLCAQLKVRGVPALLVFNNGHEVARLGTGLTPANISAKLGEALGALI
ncbi:MAG: thioredoxin family protein [Chloroflexi bacterium]|nr:thioredoxin family protein [Chloroflexota bacterium]